jgi:hypothetical protein
MKRDHTLSMTYGSRSISGIMARTALITVIAALAACSSLGGSSDGSWTVSYFKDPDRVWNGIELVLIEQDYSVTEESRPDGVMRAVSDPAPDGTVIALAIDQVMHTNDQVKVYVKPSFEGNEGSRDPDLLKAAADDFVKALDGKLKG